MISVFEKKASCHVQVPTFLVCGMLRKKRLNQAGTSIINSSFTNVRGICLFFFLLVLRAMYLLPTAVLARGTSYEVG